MTKPIILVKACYKTVVFHSSSFLETSLMVTSWPQLISQLLVAHR